MKKVRGWGFLLLIFFSFFVLACQDAGIDTRKAEGENSSRNQATTTSSKDTLRAEKGEDSFTLKTIDYKDLLAEEKELVLKGSMVLAFDPVNGLVYEDVSPEDLGGTRDLRIEHIGGGKDRLVRFHKTYPYIDGIKSLGDSIKIIGTDLEGNVDLLTMDKEGNLKGTPLTDGSKIAVNQGDQGFVINIEKDLGNTSYKTAIYQLAYDGNTLEKFLEEPYRLKEDKVEEGVYLSNAQEVQGNMAWQELKQVGEKLGPVENTQIFFKDDGKTYSLPFIQTFCSYLGGTKDFILALKARNTDGSVAKDQGTLYLKDQKGYKSYPLPGYEYSNFIRTLRQVDENLLWVQADRFMDFIRLDTKEIYRLNQGQELKDSLITFGLEGSTLYSISRDKDGKVHLTYGQVETDKLK